MIHVSIVILHYNTPRETHSCLRSLKDVVLTKGKCSVIVVDNASRETFQLTQTEIAQGVQLIRSNSNLGFTGGNNLGMQYAVEQFNSDFVCLLNSDTLVAPTFLQKMIVFLENNAKIGAVSPLIYFEKNHEYHASSYTKDDRGKVIWFGGGSIDWHNLLAFHKHVDEVDRGQVRDSVLEDYLTGCCMLIRREVLEKVNGFDNRYFLYLEDVDLSIRIQEAGYSLGLCAESIVWHANAGSSGGSGSSIHQYYQTRNRALFFWSYGTIRQKLTIMRWAARVLATGKSVERKAVLHVILQRYGKETAI